MKKIFTLLLALLFTMGISIGANAVNAIETDSLTKVPFEYKITPKSPEWKTFTTVELKEKLNISLVEVENMDTETLLNVVLDYPFLGDIYAFDTSTIALNFLADQFNGLKVLLKREDFKDKLVNSYIISSHKIMKYENNEKIGGEERNKQKYREALISYPTVFNKLSNMEINTITVASKQVAPMIDTNPLIIESPTAFGLSALASGGAVIRTGTVYTPKGKIVSVKELTEMTAADKTNANNQMAATYPNAIRLREPTYKYNCHSYAWYSTSSANLWWMNYPSNYMTDGSYLKVTTAAANDKIFWPNPGYEHSGIIKSVSGSSKTVISKWGACGLYQHLSTQSPYSSSYATTYWRGPQM